nr:rac GTP binding protein [Hymenolepis microstoma]
MEVELDVKFDAVEEVVVVVVLDGDELLNRAELIELLATCPVNETGSDIDGKTFSTPLFPTIGMEDFGLCVETNSKGRIARHELWSILPIGDSHINREPPDNDRQYLSGMGFNSTSSDDNRVSHLYGCIDNAAKSLLRGSTITADRRMNYIRGHTNRTVFYCRVYGSRMVGKTYLLQGLLGRGLHEHGGTTVSGATDRTSAWAAATSIPVCDNLRTLLLHEISAGYSEQMGTEEALSADVAGLLYDSTDPESFRFVANIFLEFCSKYHLHDPIPFSSFDIRPRFMEDTSGPVDGARYRRSSADTVTPTDKRRISWFLDDNDSPEASPISFPRRRNC